VSVNKIIYTHPVYRCTVRSLRSLIISVFQKLTRMTDRRLRRYEYDRTHHDRIDQWPK